MPSITIVSEKTEKTVDCGFGARLSDLLLLHEPHFDFPCAGKGKCLQCRVIVRGDVSPPSVREREALSAAELEKGIRLACFTEIRGGARIELSEKPKTENIAGCGVLPDFDLNPQYEGFAAAVDIGTTTLAASLCAAGTVGVLKTQVMKNPQTAYGSDVISRIELALAGKSAELASCVRTAINQLLAGLRPERDYSRITLAGNTVMLYLLTRQNPACLSQAPFTLDRPFGETLTAADLGLNAPPETPVYLPRCLSAFVGADITAAIVSSRLCSQKKPSLLVDIGTNGEMALFVPQKNTLFVCSTAAGPAFEGEGIAMGMRGVAGAIDSVTLAGQRFVCGTIGGEPAAGICGSGIIDAAAVLKQTGIIDETGSIQEEGHDFEDLITEYRGETAVAIEKNVVITQKDIRSVQLAKSAICAGLLTLLSEAALTEADIGSVFVAGGFGSYVNLQNAALIGLIPASLCARTQVLGNAALGGAVLMTQNGAFIAESEAYDSIARVVNLAVSKTFMDLYVSNMLF